MKLLTDHDVYAATTLFIGRLGHQVVSASQLGMAQAKDIDLLDFAHEGGRIFVTRDRDFGSLVFVQRRGPGVIYLRVLPSTLQADHAELERVLSMRRRSCRVRSL